MNQKLEESTTSVIKRTRQTKLAALSAGFALRIAKQQQDPLYKKYQKFRKLFWNAKKLLVKRYGARGMMAARKALLQKKK
ncbi:MAG: hypothetical protein ACOC33_00825 [bacterium]